MIIDTSLVFSDQQVVTASTSSSNSIDLGATGTPFGATNPLVRDIGRGEPIDLSVSVAQTFVGPTSIQVSVQTSPDSVTWTNIDTGAIIPVSQLVAGYLFRVPRIVQQTDARYLRLFYTVIGTATQGTINAAIVASRQSNLAAGGI
jgi:hypothetical protein